MKTLADLKRELKVGEKITIDFHFAGRERDTKISKVQSNAFSILNEEGNNSRVSLPKSNLIEFDGDSFTIYEEGFIYPNVEESKLIDEVVKYRQTEDWVDFWNKQSQDTKDKYHSLCMEFNTTDNERKKAKRSDNVRGQKLYTFSLGGNTDGNNTI